MYLCMYVEMDGWMDACIVYEWYGFGMVCFCIAWLTWYGIVWNGIELHAMIWYGMYGMYFALYALYVMYGMYVLYVM